MGKMDRRGLFNRGRHFLNRLRKDKKKVVLKVKLFSFPQNKAVVLTTHLFSSNIDHIYKRKCLFLLKFSAKKNILLNKIIVEKMLLNEVIRFLINFY